MVAATLAAATDPRVDRINRKIETIQSGLAKPGSMLVLPAAELDAWARAKAAEEVPDGLRQTHLELGNGTATADGLVDFVKLRHAAGVETSWLVSKLIQGEKRVKATARIESASGRATVHLTRVEIGGLAVSGAPLDLLIQTFILPLYPNAKIDEPFELADRVDRIEVKPAEVRVWMKK
jgi:hypothetical protein